MTILGISFIYQIIIAVASLIVILLILFCINFYLMSEELDDSRATENLRDEIEHMDILISKHNLFNKFIDNPRRGKYRRKESIQ